MEVRSCPGPADWQRYVLGLVGEAEQHALEAHLERCPACLAQLQNVPGEDTLVTDLRAGRTLREEPTDAAVEEAIRSAVGLGTTSIAARTAEIPLDFLAPASATGEIGRLAHFRVLRLLGRGGMGLVFLAEDTTLRRRVALKVLAPDFARRPAAAERFLREARAAAALHHDHVVTIYQVGEADTPAGRVPFLAMELLEGESLETALARGPLPLAEVVRVGREIAEGLAAAHESGLIHRDVKPDNVWLESPRGRVKLLDFGLARAAEHESRLTEHGVVVGTPAYMAPEQAAGRPTDARADLFSLGCVLYRACTGRLPFAGGDVMTVLSALATQEPTPVRQLNPAVPPALADLVHRLLAKDPVGRPASARAVAVAFRAVGEHPSALARPRAWRRGAILAVLVGVVVLAVALLRDWGGKDKEPGAGAPEPSRDPAPPTGDPGDGSGYVTAWREDFENVAPGQFPHGWVQVNNAWAKDNGAVEGDAAQGQRCLRLSGSRTKQFSADALINLSPGRPFTLRFWVRQGDEEPRPGVVTHVHRGGVSLGPPTEGEGWDRDALVTVFPGRMSLAGAGAPLAAGRWREVVIRRELIGEDEVVTAWVDAAFVGQRWRRIPDRREPTQLWLMAAHGALWFDDVQLLHDADMPVDREATAAWVAALRQHRDRPGPASAAQIRAFAEKYRSAPALRHRQLAQAAEVQAPADLPILAPATDWSGHTAPISGVAWSPDGQSLATAATDGTARLWRRDGSQIRQLGVHPAGVSGLAFAPDGKRLAAAGGDGVVRVYRTADGEEVQALRAEAGPLTALAWAPDGRLLTGGKDGAVRAWDLGKGKPVELLEQHEGGPVAHVSLSADGKHRVTVAGDGLFLDGRRLARPEFCPAALTADGTRVAAPRSWWELVIWDTATGKEVLTLPYDAAHLRLAYSSDGRYLALAWGFGRVELRDAAGKEVARLPVTRPVTALAFTPDGKTLVSGDMDGRVRVWNLRTLSDK